MKTLDFIHQQKKHLKTSRHRCRISKYMADRMVDQEFRPNGLTDYEATLVFIAGWAHKPNRVPDMLLTFEDLCDKAGLVCSVDMYDLEEPCYIIKLNTWGVR